MLVLYPDIIRNICLYLNYDGCLSLKWTCNYLYETVSEMDTVLQVKYLDRITNVSKLDKEVGRLEKGRRWITKNNPAWNSNYLFNWYCRKGDKKEVIKLLEDPKVDPTYPYNWPLIWTIYKGHLSITEILLRDERIDINQKYFYEGDVYFAYRGKGAFNTAYLSVNRITKHKKHWGEFEKLLDKSI